VQDTPHAGLEALSQRSVAEMSFVGKNYFVLCQSYQASVTDIFNCYFICTLIIPIIIHPLIAFS
jgi:hypothetical protein